MDTQCSICQAFRSAKNMYFKFRKTYVCKYCLVNGLTINAKNMFNDDSEEAVLFFKKIYSDGVEGEFVIDG